MTPKQLSIFGLLITVLLTPSIVVHTAQALTTVPQTIVYNGHLLDSSGDPITTSHDVRFSYWRSGDFVAGDITGAGAVNVAAVNYAGWNETHTVTPNGDGYFSVRLGSLTALPDISAMPTADLLSLFIQVEVKASADADTQYELMDINSADATDDRSPVLSVPFAQNADFIDQREIGTGSGDIAILNQDGVFDPSLIPGATNSGAFVIDFDDTEASNITLKFGNTLNEYLDYSITNDLFTFSSDVNIQGDLTVTGLVNGIDLSNLVGAADATHLRVSSGAGLLYNVAAGSYRINGVTTNYPGSSNNPLVDATTNYVFLSGTGLQINQLGFPDNRSIVPLAEVVTAAGTVNNIDDRRVLQSDDREIDTEIIMHPLYANASLSDDGTDNIGRLFVDYDDINQKNFYHWTSSKTTLQDYDIIVKAEVPDEFLRWSDPSISLEYRSTNAAAAENQLDISVFDTAGAAVTLVGGADDLSSVAWTSTDLTFGGSPTWTAGEDFTIRLRVQARNNEQMHIGSLQIRFEEFLQ